jgi:hypothetical protein
VRLLLTFGYRRGFEKVGQKLKKVLVIVAMLKMMALAAAPVLAQVDSASGGGSASGEWVCFGSRSC